MQIASWLGLRICVYFPFSVLGFSLVWTYGGLVHSVMVYMSSYMFVSPVLQDILECKDVSLSKVSSDWFNKKLNG